MIAHACILAKLHDDVAAAKDPGGSILDEGQTHVEARVKARARLAALPGPALLESLLWAQEAIARWLPNPAEFDEHELALIGDRRAEMRAAIALAATALEVPH